MCEYIGASDTLHFSLLLETEVRPSTVWRVTLGCHPVRQVYLVIDKPSEVENHAIKEYLKMYFGYSSWCACYLKSLRH